jgi:hypothetical protein
MFYSLAADAHPGYDGAPRKAILRYQYPAGQTTCPSFAPSTAYPTYSSQDSYGNPVPIFPPTGYGYAMPQPAQFANAGPPGYAYNPSVSPSYDTGLGIYGLNNIVTTETSGIDWNEKHLQSDITPDVAPLPLEPHPTWKARSQWSSPLSGAFDPKAWQHV